VSPSAPARARRTRLLTATAAVLTAAGIVLAVLSPDWPTGPLRSAVTGAGALGPVVFLLLAAVPLAPVVLVVARRLRGRGRPALPRSGT
jgi:hypothetical protein